MRAFVTGATGFIGSHFAEELLKRGYDVTCLARKTSDLRWLENLDLKVVYGDCSDKGSLLKVIPGFDLVFHLAGLTKAKHAKDLYEVNADGTENLINAVAEKNPGIKRFIYLSSLAAAGPSLNSDPLKEDSEPLPVSEYGKSKLAGEKAVLVHKNRIPVTIIRPPAVYGPRDKDMFILFKMIKSGFFLCWGKCYYSLIYVDDLVRGIIACSESKEETGEIYYMSDGNIYSNYDIADTISSAVGASPIRIRIPKGIMPIVAAIGQSLSGRSNIINIDKVRELKHSHWICNNSKSRDRLGFTPKVGIKEGIKWTADWYKIHQWM